MLGVPGATSYFGAVGDDEYGGVLAKCASEEGVLVHYQKSKDQPTGTCAVLVNGGERSLVANLAAANTFTHDHIITDTSKKIIEAAKFYYISGFFLTVSVESILTIAKHSAENSKTFCMNLR
jgi:adenosine kinase